MSLRMRHSIPKLRTRSLGTSDLTIVGARVVPCETGGPAAPAKCQTANNTSNTGPESGNGEFDVLDINQDVVVKAPTGALDLRTLVGG